MKCHSKNILFFSLIIHLFALDAKASRVPILDLPPQEQGKVRAKTPRPSTDMVELCFSHLQSPMMRNMGYCLLSVFNRETNNYHALPLFNVHKRSLRTSPRETTAPAGKLEEGRLFSPRTQTKTSPREEELKVTGGRVESPRTQPYTKNYTLPKEWLRPGNALCVSFFQESISFSQGDLRTCYYIV